MIQLFENIENYKNLDLRDMTVVAQNFDYFVPPINGSEFWKHAYPLIEKTKEITRKYFSAFIPERKEMADLIGKYFNKNYFNLQKSKLKNNMFDTNYALKDYLNKMTKEQLEDFGYAISFCYIDNYNFMTHWNWLLFLEELAGLAPEAGFSIERQLKEITKEQAVDLFLKYIDLNIILADNLAEAILDGIVGSEAVRYVWSVVNSRYNNVYKMRILM